MAPSRALSRWTRPLTSPQCRPQTSLQHKSKSFFSNSTGPVTKPRPGLLQPRRSAQWDQGVGFFGPRFPSKTPARDLHKYWPFQQQWTSKIGAEPGIHPGEVSSSTELTPSSSSVKCDIKVIDYSSRQLTEHIVTADTLESFLIQNPKPEWACVRWIYVNGVDLNVVRCLGNSKGLHPLAIEDVMDTHTPTKVDWYDSHCFLEMNMVTLIDSDPGLSRKDDAEHPRQRAPSRWRTLIPGKTAMSVEQVSAFLTTDDILITIFEHSGEQVFAPIMTRLQSVQTVVRSSNDPSMLLQAVIDAIVDLSLPIGKAVGEAFDELEQAVLTEPTIGQSKQLHVLRSGLTLLMENANEIGIVVRTLCDHGAVPGSGRGKSTGSAGEKVDLTAQVQTSVHISPTTQIYLRDVQDHVTALSNNTRTSIRSAENLSSLIFNTIAASQNESVRQLTILSAFFLPLTFLTGYFGMNFDPMPAVNNHSDALFWWIAGPIMLASGALVLRTRAKANRPEAWMRQPRPMQMNTRRHRRRPCGEKSESL